MVRRTPLGALERFCIYVGGTLARRRHLDAGGTAKDIMVLAIIDLEVEERPPPRAWVQAYPTNEQTDANFIEAPAGPNGGSSKTQVRNAQRKRQLVRDVLRIAGVSEDKVDEVADKAIHCSDGDIDALIISAAEQEQPAGARTVPSASPEVPAADAAAAEESDESPDTSTFWPSRPAAATPPSRRTTTSSAPANARPTPLAALRAAAANRLRTSAAATATAEHGETSGAAAAAQRDKGTIKKEVDEDDVCILDIQAVRRQSISSSGSGPRLPKTPARKGVAELPGCLAPSTARLEQASALAGMTVARGKTGPDGSQRPSKADAARAAIIRKHKASKRNAIDHEAELQKFMDSLDGGWGSQDDEVYDVAEGIDL